MAVYKQYTERGCFVSCFLGYYAVFKGDTVMAKREITVSAVTSKPIAQQYVEYLDEVIAQYKDIVFGIAVHLTGCQDAAKEVAEEVFVRLYWALPDCESGDELESLVHEFAYECAIARLVGNVDLHVKKTRELLVQDDLVEKSDSMQRLTARHYDDGVQYDELDDRDVDSLVLVRNRLNQAIEMMSDAAKNLKGCIK